MKRVLFITFFWPPSGKASLHWPLKIIKHLPQFNWQPVVLTVNEDTFSTKDESMLDEVDKNLEVIKTNYFDPFVFYRKFLGKSADEPLIASETISKTNKSFNHKLSIWIRMNLFVPDARIGWYRQAVKAAEEYLSKNPVDAIVSIGPPHSSHLIGKKISKLFRIPHVPVLIDPWVDISYYRGFKRNRITLWLDNHFEKSVLQKAAHVVFVTKSSDGEYQKKYPWLKGKSSVLYWGYNEEDFSNIQTGINGNEEIILHAGNIFDFQNPLPFWQTIKNEILNGRNLKLKFIGTVGSVIKKALEELGLGERTEYLGFLPYNQVLQEMCNANYLLMCATEKRHIPGKLFEYLRTGRPIIAFGDDNDEVKRILEETNAGCLFSYKDGAKEFFELSKKLKTKFDYVKKYDRKNIAKELGNVLNGIG
ncbi:MAG: glycosyltransferase [Ignavibacteriales bacterium]|nr:glycosyltransferase [Ignavibacteriales bacterium]